MNEKQKEWISASIPTREARRRRWRHVTLFKGARRRTTTLRERDGTRKGRRKDRQKAGDNAAKMGKVPRGERAEAWKRKWRRDDAGRLVSLLSPVSPLSFLHRLFLLLLLLHLILAFSMALRSKSKVSSRDSECNYFAPLSSKLALACTSALLRRGQLVGQFVR